MTAEDTPTGELGHSGRVGECLQRIIEGKVGNRASLPRGRAALDRGLRRGDEGGRACGETTLPFPSQSDGSLSSSALCGGEGLSDDRSCGGHAKSFGKRETTTFFLVAGEASGDLLGARLMRALKAKVSGGRFVGIGGPQMQAEGIELLFPHTELMHFGIVEVARHIPRLLKRIEETAQAVVDVNPEALITIDSPDFSFRVAKRVRELVRRGGSPSLFGKGILSLMPRGRAALDPGFRRDDEGGRACGETTSPFPSQSDGSLPSPPLCGGEGQEAARCDGQGQEAVLRGGESEKAAMVPGLRGEAEEGKKREIRLIHYVAPTVWAWRPGRAKKIAKLLDHLLAVFPFEPPYFTREGLPCTFVGHSVVEGNADKGDAARFRKDRGIPENVPLLAVLPGSRTSEITRLLPVFRETVKKLREKHSELRIVVPTVPHLKERLASEISGWGVPSYVVEGEKDKFDAFAACTAALACSGTVALELALALLPGVIAYKLNPVTVALFRRLIKVKYANLVNIMHDEMVVPEYLQKDCTPEKLFEGVDLLLSDKSARKKQIAKLEATAEWLGKGKFVPSERAAQAVLDAIEPPVVMQVLPALVTGGVERGTVETTAALVKAGIKAIVASEGGPLVKDVEAAGGIHITLPLASKNPVIMAANAARLSGIIRDKQVDIVHARSRAPAWSAWAAAKKTGATFVTTFHNAYGAGSAVKRFYNSVMGKGARVIAISEFVGDYAVKTYGVPRDILKVIPRGVDIEAFDPDKVDGTRVEALRKAWGVDGKVPVILMPARFSRWKGHLVLLQALAQMRGGNFLCVIVGGGKDEPFGKEVMAEIEALRLKDYVKVFDTCADMPAAYRLADVVVVPSTRPEGFGRVVVEAQAMGVPVIAASHGGAKETVIPGKTGWLVVPGDAADLAETLGKVLRLPADQKGKITAGAAAHVRDHFTTDSMTSQTLEIYQDLLLQRRLNRE